MFLLVYPYFKVCVSAFLDEIPELHMWLLTLTLTQISGQRKDRTAGRSRCCGTPAATSRDCPAVRQTPTTGDWPPASGELLETWSSPQVTEITPSVHWHVLKPVLSGICTFRSPSSPHYGIQCSVERKVTHMCSDQQSPSSIKVFLIVVCPPELWQ